MKIENFKRVDKGSIICSFDVFFEDRGWGIRDFKLMISNDKRWIAHPSRQYKDGEGKNKYYQFTYFEGSRKIKFDEQIEVLLKPFLDSPQNPIHQPHSDESIPF